MSIEPPYMSDEETMEAGRRQVEMGTERQFGDSQTKKDIEERLQIGKELREQRVRLGYPLHQVAELTGLSYFVTLCAEQGICLNEELAQCIEPLCTTLGLDAEAYIQRVPLTPTRQPTPDEIAYEKEIDQRLKASMVDIRRGGQAKADALRRGEIGRELMEQRNQLFCSKDEMEARSGINVHMLEFIELGFVTNEELAQCIEPLCTALGLEVEEYKRRIPNSDTLQGWQR
jgi:hypothetical protein